MILAYGIYGLDEHGIRLLPVKIMSSWAINPISAYLLFKEFDWEMTCNELSVSKEQVPTQYDEFAKWFESCGRVILHIELTPGYRERVIRQFSDIVKQISTKTHGTCL